MVSPKVSEEQFLPARQGRGRSGFWPLKWIITLATIAGLSFAYLVGTAVPLKLFKEAVLTQSSALSLEQWMDQEASLAFDQIYQNLGGGLRAKDAAPGAVIASPSTEHPDYYYQWVRDAAIIYKTLIGEYVAGNKSLDPLIRNWAESQDSIQRVSNPSGTYNNGGIGEPKFQVDNTPFTGSWGRPQNDGPAIRATALMAYADHHNAKGLDDKLMDLLYKNQLPPNSVIKADLDYVSHHWNADNFDLWEEVNGLHFFTLIVQLRSMLEGVVFASSHADDGAADWYGKQASLIRQKIDEFWNEQGWIVSTLEREHKRSGLDCGVILGSLHGMSANQTMYNPDSDRMLSTHYHYVQRMKKLYQINKKPDIPGVAVGRYEEDIYDGYSTSKGNPWYLCTTAAAEMMYAAINLMEKSQSIQVTSTSEQFFQQFLESSKAGQEFPATSDNYKTIVHGMRKHGDSFMAVVRHFAQTNGSLSEQFNRDTGSPQGARDLTWSYGAFISAVQARRASTIQR